MKIFFFTATGNSLFVAKQFNGEQISIPQALQTEKLEYEADVIGFVFPCFYGGLPPLVIEFIEKRSFKADYVFMLMTYGNFAAGGLSEILKHAARSGITVDYSAKILMVNNYLPLFETGKQKRSEAGKKVDQQVTRILKDISERKKSALKDNTLFGVLSCVMQRFYKGMVGTSKQFTITAECTGCGICASVCPVGNIEILEKPVFKDKCQLCLGCVHNCPEKAITMKGEKSRERYLHKGIKLAEIITANRQGDK